MKKPQSIHRQRLIRLASRRRTIRPKDLEPLGIPRTYLQRLVDEGIMERVARGVYRMVGGHATRHATLVEVAKRVPDGVACLLTALQFHEIGTQLPSRVWLAVERKAWKPRVGDLPVYIVRFSAEAFTEGVERHKLEGVLVRVYSAPKTVVDCFKYRNKIGLDVGVEALRDCLAQRKCTYQDLWRYAKICRVANVMRPYMEAIA
jgi:predicted transcriptional regulator of viral defense system